MYVTMCVVIKAEQVSNDSVYEGYAFPDEDDNLTAYTGGNAQLMIPSELIQNISKSTYVAWYKNFNGYSGLCAKYLNSESGKYHGAGIAFCGSYPIKLAIIKMALTNVPQQFYITVIVFIIILDVV